MRNVLYVFNGEKASGAERVIERLIKQNQNSVNAHLFIAPGDFAQDLRKNNNGQFRNILITRHLKKLNRSGTNRAKFYLKAVKNHLLISILTLYYARKHDIEIIHANTIVPAAYLLPAVWFSKIFFRRKRWIWSDHDLRYFSSVDHKISALNVKSFDLTLAVSDAVKSKFTANNKIVTLYNGLNIDEFDEFPLLRKSFRDNLHIKEEAVVIGLVGTIEPRKGQLNLIESFIKLQQIHKNILLLLAGSESADHSDYFKDVMFRLKNKNEIIYLGKVADMVSFYNGCDIVISNSSNNGSEPLGTSIYEAMACNRIVIATDTGGTSEIIIDKRNGFLIKADAEDELYQMIDSILSDVNNLKPIAVEARKQVETKFNIVNMAFNYNILLDSIIKDKE